MTSIPLIDSRTHGCKTLIICPIGLGNFIMATPALQLLSKELGRQNLHFLALKPGMRLMARESNWFAEVHYWDPDNQALFGGIKLLHRLRQLHFDFSISLFPSSHWKFCLFAWLIAAKTKLGFDYGHSPVPRMIQNQSFAIDLSAHDSEQNLSLVQSILGLPATSPEKLIFTLNSYSSPDQDLKNVDYFVCHPGSSLQRGMLQKRLPADKFSTLIDKIFKTFGLKCLLLGGAEEKDLRASIASPIPEAILNYESQDLQEVGAYITHAKFFLGNDSGMMHFCVALNKKCIVFFGPSDETRTGPYYLPGTRERKKWGLSRGHLIIRHEQDLGMNKKTAMQKPRLRHRDSDGLLKLDVEETWLKMEPFIRELLNKE